MRKGADGPIMDKALGAGDDLHVASNRWDIRVMIKAALLSGPWREHATGQGGNNATAARDDFGAKIYGFGQSYSQKNSPYGTRCESRQFRIGDCRCRLPSGLTWNAVRRWSACLTLGGGNMAAPSPQQDDYRL
jgi:hypothetical protein